MTPIRRWNAGGASIRDGQAFFDATEIDDVTLDLPMPAEQQMVEAMVARGRAVFLGVALVSTLVLPGALIGLGALVAAITHAPVCGAIGERLRLSNNGECSPNVHWEFYLGATSLGLTLLMFLGSCGKLWNSGRVRKIRLQRREARDCDDGACGLGETCSLAARET